MKPLQQKAYLLGPELVRAEMKRQGLSNATLAARCGLAEHAVACALSEGVPFWPTRWKLENALNFAVSLWSPSNEVEARQFCIRTWQVDPRLLSRKDLIAFCRERGVSRPPTRHSEAWFQALMQWLAANPKSASKAA